MKTLSVSTLVVLLFATINIRSLTSCNNVVTKQSPPVADSTRLKSFEPEALEYCKRKDFNTEFCFLVDMSIHSGKNRFFVWSFKQNKIMMEGLVTHGCGCANWCSDQSKAAPVFSNTPDSHCSSLGKYQVGERGYSMFGMHVKYLLHGLDTTNSNALKRVVVLHSWERVPDDEIYPSGAPESWGCPAVSNNFMKKLDDLLMTSAKPVLLWIVK